MNRTLHTNTTSHAAHALIGRLAAGLRVTPLLIALALVSACQETAPPPPVELEYAPPPIYTLGPGDRIRVTVFQNDDLSGEFEIDSTGRVALPLIRGIDALGLTLPGLEEVIIRRLQDEQYLNPRVSIDLIKTRPVCVLGEVTAPGCFDYLYGLRVAGAIAMAGGYSYRAKTDSVRVIRSDGKIIAVDHHTLLYPGDVIEVDERFF